ncbi:hypothetical protein COO91_10514 (plasmid) [Nostoc flagelliforme CCNUN1]|uniref:Uncharacterized protein n=1 Tax=Nostoc flagelliforme CCNUN1 TaxID=2038116 RepID=A0A2K8T9G3_9NOSO|nr:hypothetical protein [Nostoc flagelliforme]AUB44291.1 hypothetical protein COO91_10514 [Nostoc flagelliforme CCNUN1]
MAELPKITLLALLIALEQLETPLGPQEKQALENTAQQLYLDPDDWDFIKEGLMAVVEANPKLSHNYCAALAQLQMIKGNIPSEQMFTQEEVETELPRENKEPTTFGFFEGEPDRESDEILNLTIDVLTRKEPEKAVKNLSFLKRLRSQLSKPQTL